MIGRTLYALLAWVTLAGGHTFEPAVLDVRERSPGVYDVIWKSPGSGAATAGLDQLQPRFPTGCRAQADAPTAGDEATVLRLDCRPQDLHGQPIAIDGLARTRLDTFIRIQWLTGAPTVGVARANDDTFVVPGVAVGVPVIEVLSRYGRLGIAHMLSGTDHLLFVLGMLLLVAPAGALVRTVTAFTVAHSVTLAGAVFGVLRVPAAPVEVTIALSIVLLATELARPREAPPTLTRRSPWLVAFGFGLLHGLGFAGALAAVGLPADQVPVALFAFNVGVEIGQLSFVAVMLLPVLLWRRRAQRLVWRLLPAYAIGTVAMAWTIERAVAMFG